MQRRAHFEWSRRESIMKWHVVKSNVDGSWTQSFHPEVVYLCKSKWRIFVNDLMGVITEAQSDNQRKDPEVHQWYADGGVSLG